MGKKRRKKRANGLPSVITKVNVQSLHLVLARAIPNTGVSKLQLKFLDSIEHSNYVFENFKILAYVVDSLDGQYSYKLTYRCSGHVNTLSGKLSCGIYNFIKSRGTVV